MNREAGHASSQSYWCCLNCATRRRLMSGVLTTSLIAMYHRCNTLMAKYRQFRREGRISSRPTVSSIFFWKKKMNLKWVSRWIVMNSDLMNDFTVKSTDGYQSLSQFFDVARTKLEAKAKAHRHDDSMCARLNSSRAAALTNVTHASVRDVSSHLISTVITPLSRANYHWTISLIRCLTTWRQSDVTPVILGCFWQTCTAHAHKLLFPNFRSKFWYCR